MGIGDKIKEVLHHDSAKTSTTTTNSGSKQIPGAGSAEYSTGNTSNSNYGTTQSPHDPNSPSKLKSRVDSDRDASGTIGSETADEERDTVPKHIPSGILGAGVHNSVTGAGSARPLDRHDSTLNRDRGDYEPEDPLPHDGPQGTIGSEDAEFGAASGGSQVAGRY